MLSVNAERLPGREVVPGGRATRETAGVRYDYFPVAWPRRWLRSPALERALPEAVAWAEIVEIHGLYLHPLIAGGQVCRRLGRPYLLRPLGTLDPVIQQRRRWRKRLAGLLGGDALLRGAAALHFTSEAEAAIAAPWSAGRPGVVAPLGVPPYRAPGAAALAAARRAWLAEGGGPLLLFLSRLAPKKGLEHAIAALPALAAAHPGIRLLVAGSDEGSGWPARRLADRLGVGARTIFAGHLDGEAKAAAFALADLFLLPSQSENFGLAALEAAAAGLPALLAPGVALADELAAGGAAETVAAEPAAIAAAAARLLADEPRRRAMAAAGPSLVAARHGWPAAARRLQAACERVLAGHRP